MTPDEVLAALDPEQREAVRAVTGPVCILAGAGTGKTRTITHRAAYAVLTGAVPAPALLAVTYTARAAGEMRTRLRALGVEGVQARTFHAAALRQLSYFWPRVVGGPPPRLVDNPFRLVANAAAKAGLKPGTTELRDLLSELEWAASCLIGPEDYPVAAQKEGRQPPFDPATVAQVYAVYGDLKQSQGQADFADLLLLTAAVLEEHADVAAEFRSRYRSFVVDEYQDVTPLQQRLLDAWLGGRDDVCVVGDAQQTIYSFTGASSSYLLRFRHRYPGATEVRLVRDYRSTPQVVDLANRVLARASGTAARLELVAQRPAGPPAAFAAFADEPAEAAAVATRCRELLDAGLPASEMAILYRVNAQSASYEAALTNAGVPYVVRGGERFFDRAEVREALLLLRGASRSAADDEPTGLLEATTEVLRVAMSWELESPPAGAGATRDRWESLAALHGLARDLAATDPSAGLRELVTELEERASAQHAPTVQGVTLASLHAAKGLEWDAVFLVGLVDGTVPLVHATTADQVEEERRLLYVGVTRAREHLQLSWAAARSPGGRASRQPSRFLDGLIPGALAGTPTTAPARRRARSGPATCRVCGASLFGAVDRKLGRCGGCPADRDEALFDSLRSWRAARAKDLGQPAFCVFTDVTLTAIAEQKPTNVSELVAIPGIGQAKLDRFGEEVLALVGSHKG
ncbi:MAG TPA: ATP-dependent DNA helicase UvrD2 [Mycobacteriales bacterium]|nr:ATP-dependent DNA helicase UvrD2 [Mycobacteriales bacterium]